MTTLLYRARQIGYICHHIANVSEGKIEAVCDKDLHYAAVNGVPVGDKNFGQMLDKIDGAVIRWDSRQDVEADKTYNTAEAVRLSRNKSVSRAMLLDLAPPTWFRLEDCQYPCLVRPRRHFAAHKFFPCSNRLAARKAIRRCGKGWYASPIIDKKLEYRVFVFNGKAIKVVRRFHNDPNEIAWNAANDGRSVRLLRESWPDDVVKSSIQAGKALGLDWFAADVIVDQADQPYVLELNSAPGIVREKTIRILAREFTKGG